MTVYQPKTSREFRAWISAHPDGFVVNHEHTPGPGYLVLHSASCQAFKDDRDYLSSYGKTCSEQVRELHAWASVLAGRLHRCGHCRPVG